MDLVAGEKQEIPFQGVYRLDAKGDLTLLTKDLTQPNGLAFSPDGKHFYVDDSEKRNIRVYDVAADHTLRNGRIFGEEPGEKDDGVPDGMKVDKNRQSVRHRTERHLGLGRQRPSPRHHRDARATRKPRLGRRRLRYTVHNRDHFAISLANEDAWLCALFTNPVANVSSPGASPELPKEYPDSAAGQGCRTSETTNTSVRIIGQCREVLQHSVRAI